MAQPERGGESASVRGHAEGEVRGGRGDVAHEDRHAQSEPMHVGPGGVPHQVHHAPARGRQVVHLPLVRLPALSGGLAGGHRLLALHAGVRGAARELLLAGEPEKVALAGDGLGDYIFGLDPQLLVDSAITILAMFAMFLLLSYLLFNPARDLLQKRQAYIKEQLEEAAKEKKDAIEFKAEYDEKLKAVDKEAEQILSQTRKNAVKRENEIVDEAKAEAARIVDRANHDIELEKSKVKDDVKKEMISVATVMAEKIVASSLDEEKQSQLITDTLEEMGEETWLS